MLTCQQEGCACFDWIDDHLTCLLHKSKCDQSGKKSYSKQFFLSASVSSVAAMSLPSVLQRLGNGASK
jgi:hypothetical protein